MNTEKSKTKIYKDREEANSQVLQDVDNYYVEQFHFIFW